MEMTEIHMPYKVKSIWSSLKLKLKRLS